MVPADFDSLAKRLQQSGRYDPKVAKVLSTPAPWERGCDKTSATFTSNPPMTQHKHAITPPQELVQQWRNEGYDLPGILFSEYVATRAYQAGADQAKADIKHERQEAADQELEACCELLDINGCPGKWIDMLRAARRPKPPSLKEQALEALNAVDSFGNEGDRDTIRRALEQLPDNE
jgi:hypothetical protein